MYSKCQFRPFLENVQDLVVKIVKVTKESMRMKQNKSSQNIIKEDDFYDPLGPDMGALWHPLESIWAFCGSIWSRMDHLQAPSGPLYSSYGSLKGPYGPPWTQIGSFWPLMDTYGPYIGPLY
jgi:hypothetical protein